MQGAKERAGTAECKWWQISDKPAVICRLTRGVEHGEH